MSSARPDTTSPPNSSTTPTTTKRPGEPSLGYRTATISGLVLGGMFLLAILVGLCTFRRALMNRCLGGQYCAKPPPPLPRTLSRPRPQQGLGGGGGVRQMEEASRILVPEDEILPLRQQRQTLSAFITDEIEAAPRPGVESGRVGSEEIQNRHSQDSIQSSHTWASTVDVASTAAAISVEDGNKRRSIWQDILQSFQTNRNHAPTDSISLATTTTIIPPSASTSAVVSRSTSVALLTSPTTTTTTTTPTFAPTIPITPTPHQEAVMASAASVYTQAALSSPSLSSSSFATTNLLLPPIIYCPRERAELDQLRQKYPTAAPGYTTYRLPPEGVTSPTSSVALRTGGIGGSRTRLARAVSMHAGITRVTFAEDTHISGGSGGGTPRSRRASAVVIGHTNRNSIVTDTSPSTPTATPAAATPVSTRRHHLPTSTSLPTFLTSPFLHFQNRPTTTHSQTTPAQTPRRKSRTITLRSLLLPKDPTQSENHISNYFARNARPYAPYSYPKIYAPSYSDCIDLPQIPPIPPGEGPQPQMQQDNGAGVGVDIRFSFNNIDSNANSTGI